MLIVDCLYLNTSVYYFITYGFLLSLVYYFPKAVVSMWTGAGCLIIICLCFHTESGHI